MPNSIFTWSQGTSLQDIYELQKTNGTNRPHVLPDNQMNQQDTDLRDAPAQTDSLN